MWPLGGQGLGCFGSILGFDVGSVILDKQRRPCGLCKELDDGRRSEISWRRGDDHEKAGEMMCRALELSTGFGSPEPSFGLNFSFITLIGNVVRRLVDTWMTGTG